jgi:DNA-binding response OmpR family regulator
MSGYTDDDVPAFGIGTDLILKPFAPAALVDRIRAALDQPA